MRVDMSGPPPMPHQRARSRRSKRLLVTLVLGGLLAVGLGVWWFGGASNGVGTADPAASGAPDGAEQSPSDRDDADRVRPEPGQGSTARDRDGRPDAFVPEEDQVQAPDLTDMSGADLAIARLFLEIDASERVMMAFQHEVQQIFLTTTDPTLMFDAIRLAAQRSIGDLDVLRERLNDAAPSAVRDTYVVHLESWVDYLLAIEEEPERLAGDMARWTISINATGDAFVRATDEVLTDDVDPQVRSFAEAVVERGFAGQGTAQV
jgi:hypothetical protein